MKRNLLIPTVLIFCLSMLFSVLAVNPLGASAATTVKKVTGYEYEVSYLAKDAGVSADVTEYAFTVNGVALVKPSAEEGGTTEEAQSNAFFRTTDGKKIEFLKKGTFDFAGKKEGASDVTFTVDTNNLPAQSDLRYANLTKSTTPGDPETLTEYDKYIKAVEAATTVKGEDDENRPIRVDDDYQVPSIASLVQDNYFDVKNLTGTLYYAGPEATSYSSKSISDIDSVKFEVSKVGTYSFYVLLKNTMVSMTTTDLVQGSDGWYEKDADGKPTGDLLIPVFTFTVGASSSPKITVGASEKAYYGLTYKVDCFNVVASDYNSEYTLYYSDKKINASDITGYDKTTLENLGMKEVTKENGFTDKNLFDSSAKSFTPEKKGYYYVVLHVVDFANEHSTVISRAIDATGELKQVQYETQFFKYNWVSVVLLSVAVLCFVAIIVLLCVKPKDTNTLKTKE